MVETGSSAGTQVIQDNITGRSKGFAFVEFADFAAMDKAMDEVGKLASRAEQTQTWLAWDWWACWHSGSHGMRELYAMAGHHSHQPLALDECCSTADKT
jgi:RNA recognition motif-containing protein